MRTVNSIEDISPRKILALLQTCFLAGLNSCEVTLKEISESIIEIIALQGRLEFP